MIIPIAMKNHKALKSSMLRDIARGRLCEIEAINGVVSEYGKKVDYPTPLNDKIVEMVHQIENGKRKTEWKNLEVLEAMINN